MVMMPASANARFQAATTMMPAVPATVQTDVRAARLRRCPWYGWPSAMMWSARWRMAVSSAVTVPVSLLSMG
jgi:hypothetical protein